VAEEPAERDELAATFRHPGVAGAYRHRPPYPAEVFDILGRIITDRPRRVLDIGAAEGALARPLAGRVDHVDAMDISPAMVRAGRRRPGGTRPNLRWILGAAETAPLDGPYALVTAGASLHWMSWRPTLTRLAAAMTPHAFLELMTAGEAAAFGQAVEDLVRPYAVDGVLDLPVAAELAWGRITVTAGR
jgi:trans-aconitate methyltransferase